jgi:hypothetical protein
MTPLLLTEKGLVADFFISVLNVPLHILLPVLSVIYIILFFFFSGIWAGINKYVPRPNLRPTPGVFWCAHFCWQTVAAE